jgi:farnesyl diphosphate synthase
MIHIASEPGTQSRPSSNLFNSVLLGDGEERSLAEFMEAFEAVQRCADAALTPHVGSAQVGYIARLLGYTCLGGKLIRGLSVVEIARILTGAQGEPDGEALSRARRLGWCTELLQAYFLTIDDILDGSALRRGKPCWHLVDGVGPINAINDGILLKSLVFTALNRWFSGSPEYVRMVELFHECALMTELGQMVDTAGQGSRSLPLFSMEYFLRIARNKTAYYTYVLPLECGILAAGQWGRPDVEMGELREGCFTLGEYYQAQNDMLDFANDPAITGKEGTDIQEGKCTWLIVTALEQATPSQRATLLDCYGKKDPAAVAAVTDVYLELEMPSLYVAYEADVIRRMEALMARVGRRAPEVAAAIRLLWDKTRRMGALLEKHPLFHRRSVP